LKALLEALLIQIKLWIESPAHANQIEVPRAVAPPLLAGIVKKDRSRDFLIGLLHV
jgi:hypothetical protein